MSRVCWPESDLSFSNKKRSFTVDPILFLQPRCPCDGVLRCVGTAGDIKRIMETVEHSSKTVQDSLETVGHRAERIRNNKSFETVRSSLVKDTERQLKSFNIS